jgi:hypothetical protein
MIEKDRPRLIHLNLEPDGSASLHAQVEAVFVDDAGTLIATKPHGYPVNMRLAADDKLLVGLAQRVIAFRSEEIAARQKEAQEVAERATAEAKRLSDAVAHAAITRAAKPGPKAG